MEHGEQLAQGNTNGRSWSWQGRWLFRGLAGGSSRGEREFPFPVIPGNTRCGLSLEDRGSGLSCWNAVVPTLPLSACLAGIQQSLLQSSSWTRQQKRQCFKMQLFTVESFTYKNQSRKLSYQTDKEATEEMHFRNYKVSETSSDYVPSLLKFWSMYMNWKQMHRSG